MSRPVTSDRSWPGQKAGASPRPVISARPGPAQKAGPSAATTIARTAGSWPSRRSAAVISAIVSRLRALRWEGRFSVMRAAGASGRTRTGAAVSVVSSALIPATIRPSAEDEAEPRAARGTDAADVHEQRGVEDGVRAVARLAGEVELRREHLAVRALHL